MPELPEVEITKLKLAPLLRGRRVLYFWTDWPRGLRTYSAKRVADSVKWMAADIRGRRIVGIERRGKVLFFRLSPRPGSGQAGRPPRIMAVHLRMSGRMEVAEDAKGTKEIKGAKENRWTHFRWQLSGGRELRLVDPRKFGVVWYGDPRAIGGDPYLSRIGDDARGLPRARFLELLAGRRGMVKPALLRQDAIAGIGNILADESLWRAGIHPRAALADLTDPSLLRLHYGLQETIRAVLASGGTSLRDFRHPDGRAGRYQERRLVYGRAGTPCPRCRTGLKRLVVGGRGTTICPKCQTL